MTIYKSKQVYKVAVVGDQHITGKFPRARNDDYLTSILYKLEQILQANDIVIGLGDMFDSPSIEEEALNRFFSLLLKYPDKPFYTIYGNHDLYKYSLTSIKRTSLGIALLKGFVEHLESIQIHNRIFQEIPFVPSLPVIPDANQQTILLGHYHFEFKFAKKFSLYREQIEASNAYAVILGHDHEPYSEMQLGNTALIRPGSLARNTANGYNFGRIPQYVQFDITPETISYQYVSLLCQANVLDAKEEIKKEISSTIDLESVLNSFNVSSIEVMTLDSALYYIETPQRVVDNIVLVQNSLVAGG